MDEEEEKCAEIKKEKFAHVAKEKKIENFFPSRSEGVSECEKDENRKKVHIELKFHGI